MSINKTRCRKCNGSAFFMKPHNNGTGLYCGDCGAWQKWLNKDEINAWKHYFEQLDEMRISKEEKYKKETDEHLEWLKIMLLMVILVMMTLQQL